MPNIYNGNTANLAVLLGSYSMILNIFNDNNVSLINNKIDFEVYSKSNISFKVLTNNAEKLKWDKRFISSYKGKVKFNINSVICNTVKYIVAVENGHELGYVRIVNISNNFMSEGLNDVWCIAEAYVKQAYRSNGVLRNLIKHTVAEHNVKCISLTLDRYETNNDYYNSLGFTFGSCWDTDLIYIYLSEMENVIAKLSNGKMSIN